LQIKRTKSYSNSFRFDIFIARCPGGQFFTGHSVEIRGRAQNEGRLVPHVRL